jgi:hypothetical protein
MESIDLIFFRKCWECFNPALVAKWSQKSVKKYGIRGISAIKILYIADKEMTKHKI